MDQTKITESAEQLRQLLHTYSSTDIEAAQLLSALAPFIENALAGKIREPLKWGNIPGAYYFTEGTLPKYAELETAYANFKIEITGGESLVLRNLRVVEKWHEKILQVCEEKLQRALSDGERKFVRSAGGFIALEMIEDSARAMSPEELEAYLNSKIDS